MVLQAEKLDQMLEKRREPLDAVVEFSIGRASYLFISVQDPVEKSHCRSESRVSECGY
jgi:hypothetical protein